MAQAVSTPEGVCGSTEGGAYVSEREKGAVEEEEDAEEHEEAPEGRQSDSDFCLGRVSACCRCARSGVCTLRICEPHCWAFVERAPQVV